MCQGRSGSHGRHVWFRLKPPFVMNGAVMHARRVVLASQLAYESRRVAASAALPPHRSRPPPLCRPSPLSPLPPGHRDSQRLGMSPSPHLSLHRSNVVRPPDVGARPVRRAPPSRAARHACSQRPRRLPPIPRKPAAHRARLATHEPSPPSAAAASPPVASSLSSSVSPPLSLSESTCTLRRRRGGGGNSSPTPSASANRGVRFAPAGRGAGAAGLYGPSMRAAISRHS